MVVSKMDDSQWKILLKWMIWGYPYFRKALHMGKRPRNLTTSSPSIVVRHGNHPDMSWFEVVNDY